jgi:hypothetical protein
MIVFLFIDGNIWKKFEKQKILGKSTVVNIQLLIINITIDV